MVIVAYDEKWTLQYERLKHAITKTVTHYKNIEHIGSTSIPGMYAKPIIDINIGIEKTDDFGPIKDKLAKLGYFHNGNQGIEGREAFRRNGNFVHGVLDSIKHHLYVGKWNAREFRRNLLFRDYLRRHVDYVEQYNRIKLEILQRYGENNRAKYVEVKARDYSWFFEDIIKKSQIEE